MKATEMTLPTYATYRPTGFDTAGLSLPDRQDWHVCPVIVTRDTEDPATVSNWEVFKRELERTDPEGENHETHRFGHWGPGWFEIILVRPDTATAIEAQQLSDALESYPILDDSDFSEKENALAADVWAHMSVKERVALMRKLRFTGNVLAARRDTIPYDDRMCESFESYLASHYN